MSGDLPETWTLDLDPPIEVKGGGTISQLLLQEPRTKQVLDAEAKLDESLSEASVTEHDIELVRLVAGVPLQAVQALPIVSLGRAIGYLRGFIDDGAAEEMAAVEAETDAGGVDLAALPRTVDVPIDPPVTWNGAQYGMITLREPKAIELRNARSHMRGGVTPVSVRRYQLALLTAVSGLPPAVVDGLRIRTATEATRHLARFIRAGRQAGKASPAS